MRYCNLYFYSFIFFTIPLIAVAPHNQITDFKSAQELIADVITFSCKEEPFFNMIPERSTNNIKKTTFFMPLMTLSAKARRSILTYKQSPSLYKVSIETVQKPVKGVNISFAYDSNFIEIKPQKFDPLQDNKGVSFMIYNKQKLARVSKVKESILYYVFLEGKECSEVRVG